jgi:molecular chaperone GrpE
MGSAFCNLIIGNLLEIENWILEIMSDDNQDMKESSEDLYFQIKELEQKAEANLAGWKRAQADFVNYQNRKEGENQELIQFAREVAVAKLLPTLDSLSQAIKHAPEVANEEYSKWKAGLSGIVVQLDKALVELGVKRIEAVGKKFDPNFHEAVREVDGQEDGMVAEELQTGYELNGKVIRPTTVAVTKKK